MTSDTAGKWAFPLRRKPRRSKILVPFQGATEWFGAPVRAGLGPFISATQPLAHLNVGIILCPEQKVIDVTVWRQGLSSYDTVAEDWGAGDNVDSKSISTQSVGRGEDPAVLEPNTASRGRKVDIASVQCQCLEAAIDGHLAG